MRAARGFSLLEVLMAFALLTVGLGILVAILGGGLLQVRQAGDATGATLHAQSLLDQVGVLAPIAAGTEGGELDDGRYRWAMEITEIEDPAPPVPAPDTGLPPMEMPGRALGALGGDGRVAQRRERERQPDRQQHERQHHLDQAEACGCTPRHGDTSSIGGMRARRVTNRRLRARSSSPQPMSSCTR